MVLKPVEGASEVSLSSLTSEELWRKSGRYCDVAPEVSGGRMPFGPLMSQHIFRTINGSLFLQLFRFTDRRGTSYMLGPTHEEEITTLVSRIIQSHNDIPLRLYQIC